MDLDWETIQALGVRSSWDEWEYASWFRIANSDYERGIDSFHGRTYRRVHRERVLAQAAWKRVRGRQKRSADPVLADRYREQKRLWRAQERERIRERMAVDPLFAEQVRAKRRSDLAAYRSRKRSKVIQEGV